MEQEEKQKGARPMTVAVSYKKLWKLLIDRDMRKEDLRIATGVSSGTIAKLGKDENVTVEVLAKICTVLDCTLDDICEVITRNKSI